MKPIAVTGIGLVAPHGVTPSAMFGRLLAGESAVRRTGEYLAAPCPIATAELPAPDLAPTSLRMLDRVSRLALAAASAALADAGDLPERASIGVAIGTGMGGATSTDEAYRQLYGEGNAHTHPFSVLLAMTNAPAAWIALAHRLAGPNLTYSNACASGAVAIGEAMRRIASGETRAMVAGGAEAPLNHGTLKAWHALKALASEDTFDPARSCKPFAADRSGCVLGEGAAMLVLEDLEAARARGARVHAELVGYGLATDLEHITRPSVAGQALAIERALADAGLGAEEIGYVNAHGTGTRANDGVETRALRVALGRAADHIAVSSTKSMHGHLLGAAGALEAVIMILALKHGIVPPTAHLVQRDPECDLDYVVEGARRVPTLRAAFTSSFAFGGTNAVLVARL